MDKPYGTFGHDFWSNQHDQGVESYFSIFRAANAFAWRVLQWCMCCVNLGPLVVRWTTSAALVMCHMTILWAARQTQGSAGLIWSFCELDPADPMGLAELTMAPGNTKILGTLCLPWAFAFSNFFTFWIISGKRKVFWQRWISSRTVWLDVMLGDLVWVPFSIILQAFYLYNNPNVMLASYCFYICIAFSWLPNFPWEQ